MGIIQRVEVAFNKAKEKALLLIYLYGNIIVDIYCCRLCGSVSYAYTYNNAHFPFCHLFFTPAPKLLTRLVVLRKRESMNSYKFYCDKGISWEPSMFILPLLLYICVD